MASLFTGCGAARTRMTVFAALASLLLTLAAAHDARAQTSADGRDGEGAPLALALEAVFEDLRFDTDVSVCLRGIGDRRLVFLPLTPYEAHVSDNMRKIINEAAWDAILAVRGFDQETNVTASQAYLAAYQARVARNLAAGGSGSELLDIREVVDSVYASAAVASLELARFHANVVQIRMSLTVHRDDGAVCHTGYSRTVHFDLARQQAIPAPPPATDYRFVDLTGAMRRLVAAAIADIDAASVRDQTVHFSTASSFVGDRCSARSGSLRINFVTAKDRVAEDLAYRDAIRGAQALRWGWVEPDKAEALAADGPVLLISLVGEAGAGGGEAAVGFLEGKVFTADGPLVVRGGPYAIAIADIGGHCRQEDEHSLHAIAANLDTTPRYRVRLSASPVAVGDNLEVAFHVPPPSDIDYERIFPYCWMLSNDEGVIIYPHVAQSSGLPPGDYEIPRDFGFMLPIAQRVATALHCFLSHSRVDDELHARWIAQSFETLSVEEIAGFFEEFGEDYRVSEVMMDLSITTEARAR